MDGHGWGSAWETPGTNRAFQWLGHREEDPGFPPAAEPLRNGRETLKRINEDFRMKNNLAASQAAENRCVQSFGGPRAQAGSAPAPPVTPSPRWVTPEHPRAGAVGQGATRKRSSSFPALLRQRPWSSPGRKWSSPSAHELWTPLERDRGERGGRNAHKVLSS